MTITSAPPPLSPSQILNSVKTPSHSHSKPSQNSQQVGTLPFDPLKIKIAPLNLPITDLFNLVSISRPEASTSGNVFFCTSKYGTFVIKQSTTLANEYASHLLAEKLGVPTVDMRILTHSDQDWNYMLNSVKRIASHTSPSENIDELELAAEADALIRTFEMLLQSSHVALVEFSPSIPLDQIDENSATTLLKRDAYTKIGVIHMFDCLLNNVDRLTANPLHNHDGNFGNIVVSLKRDSKQPSPNISSTNSPNPMTTSLSTISKDIFSSPSNSDSSVIGIDHMCVLLSEQHRLVYLEKLKNVLINLFTQKENCSIIQQVANGIADKTKHKLTTDERRAIYDGMIFLSKNFCNLSEPEISKISADVRNCVSGDHSQLWHEECQVIHFSFVSAVQQLLKSVMLQYLSE